MKGGGALPHNCPTDGERQGVNLSHSETNTVEDDAAFSQVIPAFTQADRGCPRQESNLRPFA